MIRFKKTLTLLAVALFWIAVWALLACLVQKPLLFPAPLPVIRKMFFFMGTALFWQCTLMTLSRILIGTLAAVVLGILLAFLTSRIPPVRTLISPLLTLIKSTPVASFIILLLIFTGRENVPSIICSLIVLPVVWANCEEGLGNRDPLLLEMASLYRMGRWRKFRLITLPSLFPYFLSACRSAFGLAWKAGIAAEVLSLPPLSIGKQLYDAKLYLETEELFAWTMTVILLSLALEFLLVFLMKKVRVFGTRAREGEA